MGSWAEICFDDGLGAALVGVDLVFDVMPELRTVRVVLGTLRVSFLGSGQVQCLLSRMQLAHLGRCSSHCDRE